MTTALYVERDATYLPVRRRLVGTMTRAEWDNPILRQAALDKSWAKGKDAIRVEDEEFLAYAPVALFCHPIGGAVAFAIVEPGTNSSRAISPTGEPLTRLPSEPSGLGWTRINTSYRTWAEGPLPHVEPDMLPARSPLDDPDLQAVRSQNSALRELIDAALSPMNFAPITREMPTMDHLVDFRIRGVFRRQDLRVLRSLQDEDLGSKIITSEGIVE